MKKILFLGLAALLFTSSNIMAQDGRRAMLKAKYDSLSPEQKKQFQEKMKQRRDSASPEQRKEMRKKMKEHYDNLPPAEQEKLKQKMKERADSTGHKPRRPHRGGRFGK